MLLESAFKYVINAVILCIIGHRGHYLVVTHYNSFFVPGLFTW